MDVQPGDRVKVTPITAFEPFVAEVIAIRTDGLVYVRSDDRRHLWLVMPHQLTAAE